MKKNINTLLSEEIITSKNKYIIFTVDKTTEKNGFQFISLKMRNKDDKFTFYEKYCFYNIIDSEGNLQEKQAFDKNEVLNYINVISEERYPILKLDMSNVHINILKLI